jgi:putative ABC transport system substrate-binding protein
MTVASRTAATNFARQFAGGCWKERTLHFPSEAPRTDPGRRAAAIDRVAAAAGAADLAHRIFQGTTPADLPVEQSGLLRMALNLKAARAIGIRIPDSIRLRADTLIQ